MLLETAYIHMKRTPALEAFATEKITGKIARFATGPIHGKLTFLVEHGKHIVKLRYKDRRGKPILLEREADNMYEAVNRMGDMLERVLRKRKNRKLAARHQPAPPPNLELEGVLA